MRPILEALTPSQSSLLDSRYMKIHTRIAQLALLTAFYATNASAAIITTLGPNSASIDFIALTEESAANGGLGESSWSVLSVSDFFGMQVTGHATDDAPNIVDGPDDLQQFAYLDWNNAGLGVCKDVNSAPTGAVPGSSANSCQPSSDDNVTHNEYLEFMFDQDVIVDKILFNNNHDGGLGFGDKVDVAGTTFDFALGVVDGVNGNGFALSAGDILRVSFNNEQFYVSGMVVSAVPVPSAIWLFGTALIGFVGYSRRIKVG
jgi:hypothetical protein